MPPVSFLPPSVFVAVSRELFKMQLDDSALGAGSLTFAAHDVTDFAEPPPFQQQVKYVGFKLLKHREMLLSRI